MAVDSSQIPVGGGGFFSNRRNVILLAAGVGGIAGLVILLSRRVSAPATQGPSTAYSATDLTLQGIANELLQFGGQQTKDAADLKAAVADESVAQGASFATVQNMLDTLSGDVSKGFTQTYATQEQNYGWQYALGLANRALIGGSNPDDITRALQRSNEAIGAWKPEMGENVLFSDLATQWNTSVNPSLAAQARRQGAGGFDARQAMYASLYDAGDGSADEWTALMSNGPVRYV